MTLFLESSFLEGNYNAMKERLPLCMSDFWLCLDIHNGFSSLLVITVKDSTVYSSQKLLHSSYHFYHWIIWQYALVGRQASHVILFLI